MRVTCPTCGSQGDVAAYLVEDDAKRLIASVVDLPAVLQRPALGYVGLFKPAKSALQLRRAHKLLQELAALVATGDVCRDERGGVRRPASPSTWAEAIEQMLAQRDSLTLPLASHGYLRAVAFGIADSADAAAERQREANARAGKHLAQPSEKSGSTVGESPLQNQLRWIAQQVSLGTLTAEDAEVERAKAKQRWGGVGER